MSYKDKTHNLVAGTKPVKRSTPQQYKDTTQKEKALKSPINRPFVVGIDSGTDTGFAVWNLKKQEFELICTFKIHTAMKWIETYADKIAFIKVEDARKATFGRNTYQDRHKAQGAGSIKRDAVIWDDFLTDTGLMYQMIRPDKKRTKLNAKQFGLATGYTRRTSEHGRDAAMMVYQIKVKNIHFK